MKKSLDVEIVIVDNEIKFMLNGEQVYLNADGQSALATVILRQEYDELFKDPTFKDCPNKILDGYNKVKKDYEKLMNRINNQ